MPAPEMLTGARCELHEPLSASEVDALAAHRQLEVVQTSVPLSAQAATLLNERLFAVRPDVQMRFYAHYGKSCDLAIVRLLPDVRSLAVDCLSGPVAGVEHIASLALESLWLGVWQLESFAFLNDVDAGLKHLALLDTKSARPDLAVLERFEQLESLHLAGQKKNIEVIAQLGSLSDVSLTSVTVPDVSFLRALPGLLSLRLILGGTRDLRGLSGSASLRFLEIAQVRGLSDLSVLGDLPGLQYLYLQSLAQLRALPALTACKVLRKVVLMNLTALRDFTPLEHAPALEEFALIEGMKQQPADLEPVLRNKSLKRAQAGFGSLKRNGEFDRMRELAGLESFTWGTPFEFRDGV